MLDAMPPCASTPGEGSKASAGRRPAERRVKKLQRTASWELQFMGGEEDSPPFLFACLVIYLFQSVRFWPKGFTNVSTFAMIRKYRKKWKRTLSREARIR